MPFHQIFPEIVYQARINDYELIKEKFASKNGKVKNAKKPYKASAKAVQSAESKAVDNDKRKAKFKSVKSVKPSTSKKEHKPLVAVESSTIKVDQKVKVQLGNTPMSAVITEISGKDISVQLDSGMVVKTQIKNIYSE